jgi:hypothetical protein
LFAKIRQICTSLKARQWSLNRGEFCHLVYPIRAQERLPKREYGDHFSEGRAKKGGIYQLQGNVGIFFHQDKDRHNTSHFDPFTEMKNDRDCSSPLHSSSLRSPQFRSAHRLSLVFRIWFVRRITPLACRDTSAPAAVPARSSHLASHRVRCC